ncbi:MAG: DEAD/DEAH box helicase [Balneolaceae bacterium]
MSFNQFRLRSDILKGLKDVKIESPSPLQKKIFKAVQEGSDLVINTVTEQKPEVGYLISVLNEISGSDRRQGTRAIILAATKERAKELDEWVWAIGYHSSIESACFTDEGEIEEQLTALSAGPVVLIATPKRLSDLLERGRLIFREVQQFIVDQAEQVDDWQAVDVISKRIIGNCQRILTAAKDSQELREAEKSLLENPQLVTVAPGKKSTEAEQPAITKDLTQYYINVPPKSKISTLMAHLDNNKTDTVVIFSASRRTADRLYKILRKSNRRAVSVHDKIDKKTFDERFGRFTSGNVQHLVVGELSADDLPLEHATQVINYDVPEDVNEYKLRAELVGSGKATRILSLVSKQDRGDIRSISKSLGYAPEEVPLPESVNKKATPSKSKVGKTQRRGNQKGKQKNKRSSPPPRKKQDKPYNELPRPTYDQLSGGRSGKQKKKGLVGFIKKLFRN